MLSIATPTMWALFSLFVLLALAVDFFALERQGAHRVTLREATVWSVV
jgi:tellurite resistance protein TerC